MATLASPGVSVSVIDESFYGSAGAGTVPLIIVATGTNKAHVSGTGTASGTTTSKTPQLVTSQRELIQTFGTPYFKSVSGTAQHGYETNEYGLLAAYSYLGSANRAYVVRADVNTTELEPSATEPTGAPADGALWLDTTNSSFGVFRYNATTGAWDKKTVKTPVSTDMDGTDKDKPSASYGSDGDYAVATEDNDGFALGTTANPIIFWQKVSGAWQAVTDTNKSSLSPAATTFTMGGTSAQPSTPAGDDIWIKTEAAGSGTNLVIKEYNSTTSAFTTKTVKPYADDNEAAQPGNFDSNRKADIMITSLDTDKLYHSVGGANSASFTILDGGSGYDPNNPPTVTIATTEGGSAAAPTTQPTAVVDSTGAIVAIVTASNDAAGLGANLSDISALSITLNGGAKPAEGSLYVVPGGAAGSFLFKRFPGASGTSATVAKQTDTTNYFAADNELETSATAIVGSPTTGTYWYDSRLLATSFDVYKKGNGGWQSVTRVTGAGEGGLGLTLTVGTTAPASGAGTGDLWIDTNFLETFTIKEYNAAGKWVARDSSDQTTSNGVVFADLTATAEDNTTTLSGSNNLGATRIANAPNPALYPDGMICVNMIHSSYHVKKYDSTLTTTTKWRSAAGNKADGSAYIGRKAQRQVVVKALQAAITTNSDIREDTLNYTLIATPGYPECADEMLALNVDRKETAFVIIDSPFRLAPTGVTAWKAGTNGTENGEDALTASGSQCATYYPSGLSTNTDGTSVVVPASHMVLRTMSYNDSIAYPWFAPAGLTRGRINNATNVGYIDSEGEFKALALNEGQRDTLYGSKVNPITNFPGQGLFIYGQKTLQAASSALDRINVARLIAYMRERLDPLARPYAFEPNDESTRAAAQESVSRFLADIMSKRGISDFAVVCDTTNNTPARIDKNELYIDVAIEPTKAAEFIYIPIRIVNTGTL